MRGAVDAFRAIDTEPYGVNQADAASHLAFIEEQELPFDLLVDEGLHVARDYDALKPDGKSISRTVVVVGKDGRIIYRASGAPPPVEIISAIGEAEDEKTRGRGGRFAERGRFAQGGKDDNDAFSPSSPRLTDLLTYRLTDSNPYTPVIWR